MAALIDDLVTPFYRLHVASDENGILTEHEAQRDNGVQVEHH